MIHIALAGNEHVLKGIELVIYSTMLHNKNIHWHILTCDLDLKLDDESGIKYIGLDKYKDWLTYIVQFMDCDSILTMHDCTELYYKFLDNSVNRTTSFSPYAAFRLLLPDIVDNNKCLWLDADTLIQGDISYLYNNYANEYDYAAYSTPNACEGFGEMISAVLVLNLDRIRYSGLFRRAIFNYNTNNYLFPDQMALRDAGDPELFPDIYNYIYDHKLASCKPIILHFTYANKFKIYSTSEGEFWRYYPEHKYIKNGLDKIRSCFNRTK